MRQPRGGPNPDDIQGTGLELTPDAQARMVLSLRHQLSERLHLNVALFETHISLVLVAGGEAYKIKKAIRTPFLDQSTRALRQGACNEELRLNRRLAPQLYLGVVPITGSPGQAELGGAGPAIDFAVRMRAFDQNGLWDAMAEQGRLRAEHIDALVQTLGAFHRGAAVAVPRGRIGAPDHVRAPLLQSLDDLASRLGGGRGSATLAQLRSWEAAAFACLQPVLAQRLAEGRVRECHGDLHLGNVTQIDGQVTVFDGIDFNADFRWIDVISEVAFMAMDLHAHRLPGLAHRFVNAYLEFSGDYHGVQVLDYYLVHRALVRAKVELLRALQCAEAPLAEQHNGRAHAYLALALQLGPGRAAQPRPAILLTHGYSGSGKSTLTQGLLEAAGAVRIRSDVERKRLAGLQPLDRVRSTDARLLYQPGMTAATYARLLDLGRMVIEGGRHVILDATFLRQSQRDAVAQQAADLGVHRVILNFEVEVPVLRQRLRVRQARGDDASDADERVLAEQLRQAEPLRPDERAAVFECKPCDTAAPGDGWQPLLERLAPPLPAPPKATPAAQHHDNGRRPRQPG
jgi:aminoglycoside phosphotransferase family enzyme/predicted kinase